VGIYREAYPTDRWLFPGDRPGHHPSARTTQIYTHVAQSMIESVRSPLDDLE
jgi:hypothetical protein